VLRIGKTETDARKRLGAQKRGPFGGTRRGGSRLCRNSSNETLPLALDAPLRVLFLRLLKADDRGGGCVIG
jgi:hypothetical protein